MNRRSAVLIFYPARDANIRRFSVPTSLSVIQTQLATAPKSAGWRFWKIIEWAKASIDNAIDSTGVDNIITQAHLLYDSYVAPVDVPWVPDVLEPMVIDRPAKQLLSALIRGFAEWADDDDEPADATPLEPTGGSLS